MKNILIIVMIIISLSSCESDQKQFIVRNNIKYLIEEGKTVNKSDTANTVKIAESIFAGEYSIAGKDFIRNIVNGGENYKYFYDYNNILNENNKIFGSWLPKENRSINISNSLSLELERVNYKKKDIRRDIKIMFYTKINGIKKDSIIFYKYQIDKDFPSEQRFETLSYLDDNFNLWNLDTYTNLSELAIGINHWDKYYINKGNGKIETIERNMDHR